MLETGDFLLAASFVSAVVVFVLHLQRKSRAGRFPPGPPGKPFVGNLLAFPAEEPWETLIKYKEDYGDLVYFHGLGNSILVLNTMETILDLFEKRAAIYSNRPAVVSMYELMGLGDVLPIMPYNKGWKAQRKVIRQGLNPATLKEDYGWIQEDLAMLLGKQILDDPDGFVEHIRLATSRTITSMTYGLPVAEADGDYIVHAEETIQRINDSMIPGSFLCDQIPILKYLPGWMPFHRRARQTKEMFEVMITKPVEYVKSQMAKGTAVQGMTRNLLSAEVENYSEHEDCVKRAVGSLYAAGGETSYTVILTCMLLMTLYPEKQRLVQREIDEVIGAGNLPTLNDRGRLPYLDAVIKETMRWRSPLPIGLPRSLAQDDVYRGYTIPKGTTVIANVWAIAFEKHGKYDPHEFVPERFLEEDSDTIPDPGSWAFGFARRICPGKAFGENSLFIYISTLLACFEILPPADGSPVRVAFSKTGVVSHPQAFKCQFKVRSPARAALIVDRAAHVSV